MRLESEPKFPDRIVDADLRAVEHLLKVHGYVREVVECIARRYLRVPSAFDSSVTASYRPRSGNAAARRFRTTS